MPGAGRLGGRGVPVATIRMPGLARAHPLIVPFRITAVLAAQLFDFGTFTLMVGRHGVLAEANPLVADGFALFGMPMVALMKVALVVLLGAIIVVLNRGASGRRPVAGLGASIAVLAVLAGLVGGISNVIAL